jgi:Proteobacterial lipase chaperone protein
VQIAVAIGTAIAAVAALASTVWLGGAPPDILHTGEAGAARVAGLADPAGASVTQRRQSAVPAPGEQPLPLSLSGSIAPRLPLDARGRLAQTRAVRDFFDYFLAAQHEMSAAALDTMVQREIASQLDGTAAQAEALDLWRRYSAYRDAVTRTAPLQAPQQVNGASSGPDLDEIQSALAQRASIARRTMGTAWSESFFGHEWRRANCDLARLRVTNDRSLTDAQKQRGWRRSRICCHRTSAPHRNARHVCGPPWKRSLRCKRRACRPKSFGQLRRKRWGRRRRNVSCKCKKTTLPGAKNTRRTPISAHVSMQWGSRRPTATLRSHNCASARSPLRANGCARHPWIRVRVTDAEEQVWPRCGLTAPVRRKRPDRVDEVLGCDHIANSQSRVENLAETADIDDASRVVEPRASSLEPSSPRALEPSSPRALEFSSLCRKASGRLPRRNLLSQSPSTIHRRAGARTSSSVRILMEPIGQRRR